MEQVLIDQYINEHYFIMGRVTTDAYSLVEFHDLIKIKYPCIVAEEEGEETHKKHFHFVLAIDLANHKDATTARESVRKYIKKVFNVIGNQNYSVKIATDPVNSVAYTVKGPEWLIEGVDDFFFPIVKREVMSKTNALISKSEKIFNYTRRNL